ncbi:MAG: SufD family Fe-S cluster assembly protein [Alphaproteobacteria bacterium]
MTIAPTRIETDAERAFREGAEALIARAPGDDTTARRGLLRLFTESGLPDRHDENYHYTDLRKMLRQPYKPALAGGIVGASNPRKQKIGTRLESDVATFVDGKPDIPVGSLGFPVYDSLNNVNALLTPGAAAISILPGQERSLMLDYAVTAEAGSSVHPRCVIEVGEGAVLNLIELHESSGDHLTNAYTEIVVGSRAVVRHVKLLAEVGSIHLAKVIAVVQTGARYESLVLAAGPRLARHAVSTVFGGIGASAEVNCVALAAREEHIDFNVFMDHEEGRCVSAQETRVVAADRARCVSQGRVRVSAPGSDARQMIRGLIIGERAEIDAKPELEILNDVKASHGTALGDLDAEAIFYLRSRGVPEQEARALLIEAFLAEILDKARHEGARALLKKRTQAWLPELPGREEAPHG